MRAAHDDGVLHLRALDVFDISRGARDQARVFLAADALPDQFVDLGNSGGHGLNSGFRGRADRVDDVLVTGAAAKIAIETLADLGVRRTGIALDNLFRNHDHARCAETTLQGVLVPEGFLNWMKLA